eukprot:5752667-Pyramimonas_sp.AAC.1
MISYRDLVALLSGDYQLLWVATPADWHARLPGKRAGRATLSTHPTHDDQGSGSAHDYCACGAA